MGRVLPNWAGATPRTFWRLKAKKVGSLPPSLVHFFSGLFEVALSYLACLHCDRNI